MSEENKNEDTGQANVPGAVHIDADGTTTGQPAGTPTDTSTVPKEEVPVVQHPTASTPKTSTSETDNTVTGVNTTGPVMPNPVTGNADALVVDPMHPASTGATDSTTAR